MKRKGAAMSAAEMEDRLKDRRSDELLKKLAKAVRAYGNGHKREHKHFAYKEAILGTLHRRSFPVRTRRVPHPIVH